LVAKDKKKMLEIDILNGKERHFILTFQVMNSKQVYKYF